MANDSPLPPNLTAIAGGSGGGMARRTDQLFQVFILVTSSNFSRRALCLHCCRGTRQAKLYPFSVSSRLRTIQTHGDEATTTRRWSTSLRGFNHQLRRLVTAPPARLAHTSNFTTSILLIADHGGSLRDCDACSGRAHKVCSPPRSALRDAEADNHPSSLPQDEVPIKLRCAICSKLAVNAFRTPCCEQMICENCEYSATQRMSPQVR